MLIWVWTRNDASGLLDDEFRDGDVLQVQRDGFPVGAQEKKSWLVIQIPDPPNKDRVAVDLVRPEYAPGPTPDENIIRRARIYTIDWRRKFTADEVVTVADPAAVLPDGPTAQGGTVTDGVISGLFTIADFSRK